MQLKVKSKREIMKKTLCQIFILLILISKSSFASNEPELERLSGKLGYLTDGLSMIKYKEARVAFQLWTQELAKVVNVDTEIKYYKNREVFISDYTKYKYDYLSLNTYYYLLKKNTIDKYTQDYWYVKSTSSKFDKLLLLVRKDSKIKTLKDLKNKKISVHMDLFLGKMFLDKEFYEKYSHGYKNHINKIVDSKKYSTSILNVFFKKVDACIVPEKSLNLISELNPAVKKQLTPILISKEFFTPLIATFHQKTNPEIISRFSSHVDILENTTKGRNILNLFKMNGLERINKSELDPLYNYYLDYIKLKKRNGNK